MIAIVDYGMGNLRSVHSAFKRAGFEAEVTSDVEKIKNADKLVLPGVGAFPTAVSNLVSMNLMEPVLEHIDSEKPFLGLCLGFQMLFDKSLEFGETEGYGVFDGMITKFPKDFPSKGLKIPHMGWNRVHFKEDNPLFKDVPQDSYFYFVHSYYADYKSDENVIGTTDYEITFPVAVRKDNVFGLQFHPEKSQNHGLTIIKNFCEYK